MKELHNIMAQISQLNQQSAQLFAQRMQLVEQMALYKQAHGLEVWEELSPHQALAQSTALLPQPELRPYFARWLALQRQLDCQYEERVRGRSTVAYQGVEGAFSHIALTRLFPDAQPLSCPTFEEVFQAVEQGRAAYGVLPFENSFAGDVDAVLDLCFAHPEVSVCRRYDLQVQQNLLALPGARLSDIRRVMSHPQAIAQSRPFLNSLGLETVECANTALAARQVGQSGDVTLAAIASAETAALYGLSVLARGINTDSTNTTRFIVISKQRPSQGNRFSLLFTARHQAGSLAQALQTIGEAGFNMECIKSRPRPGQPFAYYFYVELEGQAQQPQTGELLARLREICSTIRLLGVYTI